MIDRLLLASLRWRLRGDANNAFAGELTLVLATRFRERGEENDAQKAVRRCIAKITQQVAALDEFVNLETGRVARQ